MLAKTKDIIANLHKADTWNEDSLEFYIGIGSNRSPKKYTRDIVQYRVSAGDIGNADPSKIVATGANFELHPLQAKVFKTEDGWGFEGAVKIGPNASPAHGKEIGFQAQLNGASVKDRDVKLIWSLADTSDNSWQNPSLFGRAIFFKVGSTDVPKPSEAPPAPVKVEAPAPLAPSVSIDQVGYYPSERKLGSFSSFDFDSLPWTVSDAASGNAVASGMTSPGVADLLTGDTLHVADFSAVTRPGSYYLTIGEAKSPVFRIGDDIMKGLSVDALKYFYRTRSGIELKPEFAGATWARDAGHLSDAKVAAFAGTDAQGRKWDGGGLYVNGLGGWYDAGDFGKYVVNGGISVWTLQNAYERNPAAYKDGQLDIPESGNTYPDILDEARWELDFMLRMQIPAGNPMAGMVFHKLHDRKWSGVPSALPTEMDNNLELKDDCSTGRFAYEPTTAATLNLAACAAQAARLWAAFDPGFSARCLTAAKTAWAAARANPIALAGNVPGDGGGNYEDGTVSDEFYWAAAELFASTGDPEYLSFLKSSPYWTAFPGLDPGKTSAMSWADTAALGDISLLSASSKLGPSDRAFLEAQLIATADRYLDEVSKPGYGAPLEPSGYVWGSNSGVLNNAIVLALAYDATKKEAYRAAVAGAMDYLLGYNALRRSFVTGYGTYAASHPHHRIWADDPDSGYVAPPPGVVVGGPDKSLEDPEMKAAGLSGQPMARRYLDIIGSFATNEVAINWNAALAWVANWLDIRLGGR
jgi:endoglucanase